MLFYELSTPYIMALQYQTRSNFAAHFFQKSFVKYFTHSVLTVQIFECWYDVYFEVFNEPHFHVGCTTKIIFFVTAVL